MGLVLKYVQEPNQDRQTFSYRRRVPGELKPYLKKGELKAALGKTREEALRAYPGVHASFERELRLARKMFERDQRRKPTGDSTRLERYHALLDELRALGIDPLTPAADEQEATMREVIAEGIAARYPEDPETGYPLVDNPADTFLIRTLYSKAPAPPSPTLEDAMRVYVAEKLDGTDFEFRKKLRRVERIVASVKEALEIVPTLDNWTRDHAKKVRDYYINTKGLKPSSVKRELNTLKGIVSCFITEKEANFANPFRGLELPKSVEAPSEDRHPLPADVQNKVRAIILSRAKEDVQLVWRLLEGTGCRLAEITGLRVQDVVIDGDLPHLKIVAHPGRRLKTKSSTREVPLVGDALVAGQEALGMTRSSEALFPRYAKPTGPTTASAVLMKRIREVSDDPRHTVHSLRHSMSDRLALAETPSIDKNAILGHLNPGVGEQHYGGRYAKLRVLTRVMKRAFNIQDEDDPGQPAK